MNLKGFHFLLIAALFAIGGVVVGVAYYVPAYLYQSDQQSQRSNQAAHVYGDLGKSIAAVRLKILYVVPKNKTAEINGRWNEAILAALEQAARFHALQFRGQSFLKYDLYNKPLILREDNLFYDTATTNRGNPRALIAVAQEIERRVFGPEGDLYDPDFALFGTNEYPVLGLVYEGLGASGGVIIESELESVSDIARQLGLPESVIFKVAVEKFDGFFLLSRAFLVDPQYRAFGASLFYHEFAHTFGLADQYNEFDQPSSYDIMGSGRKQPLEATYIGRVFLKEMGVIPK